MNELQVEKLVSNLGIAKRNFLQARVKTPYALKTWMDNTLLPYLNRQVAGTEGKYKRILVTLVNATQSFYEGLNSGNASLEDAAEIGQDFKKAIALIEFEKDQDDKKLSKEQKKVDQEIGRDGLLNMTKESEPVIRKYSIYEKDLPNSLFGVPFAVKRMPLVPVTDKPLNFEKLRRLKLSADHIAFYPILLNQSIVGLNDAWVHDSFKKDTKAAAAYVIEALKEKNRVHHVIGNANHIGQVSWMWIPSDKELDLIQRAAPGGRVVIKKWGFPFNV